MPRPCKVKTLCRTLRLARGLTQPEWAEVLGVSGSYIQQIECGKRRSERMDDMLRLIGGEVTEDELLQRAIDRIHAFVERVEELL